MTPAQQTLPPNGTYGILNDSTGKYFDLDVGNVAPNTPIIGWAGHGFLNQQWVFEREGNICSIKSNLPNATIFVSTTQHVEYARVVTGKRERFEIIEAEPGKYRLKVVNQDLLFTLPNSTNGAKIQLRHAGASNDLWIFEKVE